MNPMDETRMKEDRKPPETREAAEAPAAEKLDDQDLTGAAGGYFCDYGPRNPRGGYA